MGIQKFSFKCTNTKYLNTFFRKFYNTATNITNIYIYFLNLFLCERHFNKTNWIQFYFWSEEKYLDKKIIITIRSIRKKKTAVKLCPEFLKKCVII